ncbi:hypothetical protein KR222_001834, partial [Zaprionus bogoriensis]
RMTPKPKEEQHQLLHGATAADMAHSQLLGALDDCRPRYSFKGPPPELYSPKKEFIYTEPLVGKQVNTADS